MPLKLYILGIYITKALGPSLKQPFWQPSDDLTTTLRQISIVAVERNFYPVPPDGLQNTNYFKFTRSLISPWSDKIRVKLNSVDTASH